jgi:hypothetical protein
VSTVEYGIVKFFKEEKNFGFVTVLDASGAPTNTELFFHNSNGHFLRVGDSQPDFRYETGTIVDGRVKHIKPVAKGDKIVFHRGRNDKGEKVAKWAHASQYDSIIKIIASRPVYRIVKSGTYYGKSEKGTVWQGQDIMELSAKHPLRDRFGRTSDSLDGGTADSGDMYWHFSIEQQLADGSWKSCDDPRVFLCCIPRHIFREHGSYTMDQGRCTHGNRR